MARCGRTSKPGNVCRNLRGLLTRQNKGVPITPARPLITLRAKWPKRKPEMAEYPIITFSSWATYLLQNAPRYLLGGCDTLNPEIFSKTLKTFWCKYQEGDPQHPCFQDFDLDQLGFTIPYAIHGDEGRGKNNTPVLVIAFQGIIPGRGMDVTTTKGFLECTQKKLHEYGVNGVTHHLILKLYGVAPRLHTTVGFSGTATAPAGFRLASRRR